MLSEHVYLYIGQKRIPEGHKFKFLQYTCKPFFIQTSSKFKNLRHSTAKHRLNHIKKK